MYLRILRRVHNSIMVIKWPLCRRSRRDVVERAIFHSVRSSSSPLFNWMDLFLFFFLFLLDTWMNRRFNYRIYYFIFLCRVGEFTTFFFRRENERNCVDGFCSFSTLVSHRKTEYNAEKKTGWRSKVLFFFLNVHWFVSDVAERREIKRETGNNQRDEQLVSFWRRIV